MKTSNHSLFTLPAGFPMSMDIYMEAYRKLQLYAADNLALNKLAAEQQWRNLDFYSSLLNGLLTL